LNLFIRFRAVLRHICILKRQAGDNDDDCDLLRILDETNGSDDDQADSEVDDAAPGEGAAPQQPK
jgi:hypothetical protein